MFYEDLDCSSTEQPSLHARMLLPCKHVVYYYYHDLDFVSFVHIRIVVHVCCSIFCFNIKKPLLIVVAPGYLYTMSYILAFDEADFRNTLQIYNFSRNE